MMGNNVSYESFPKGTKAQIDDFRYIRVVSSGRRSEKNVFSANPRDIVVLTGAAETLMKGFADTPIDTMNVAEGLNRYCPHDADIPFHSMFRLNAFETIYPVVPGHLG
ncbi:hypothetical protein NPIL_87931 [Nephila pilipes]|uniref:Uncharacterized protein n=1 Tax=Nephila pilipes TaxID=299642 RepID=A0A8X6PDN7_NEPPI|nr:hypothetical protein NPIL_87931 [Nephila pilipes]